MKNNKIISTGDIEEINGDEKFLNRIEESKTCSTSNLVPLNRGITKDDMLSIKEKFNGKKKKESKE